MVEFEAHIGERWFYMNEKSGMPAKMDPLNIADYKERVIDVSGSDHGHYTTPYYPLDVLMRRIEFLLPAPRNKGHGCG